MAILWLTSDTQGYIGAIEVDDNQFVMPDTLAILREVGLDVHIDNATFKPTDSDRAIVNAVMILASEVRIRREAVL